MGLPQPAQAMDGASSHGPPSRASSIDSGVATHRLPRPRTTTDLTSLLLTGSSLAASATVASISESSPPLSPFLSPADPAALPSLPPLAPVPPLQRTTSGESSQQSYVSALASFGRACPILSRRVTSRHQCVVSCRVGVSCYVVRVSWSIAGMSYRGVGVSCHWCLGYAVGMSLVCWVGISRGCLCLDA